MHTVIIWAIFLLVFTNVLTGSICWRAGVYNGTKWEKYRQRTKAVTRKQPYSGLFYGDNQNKQPPLKVVVKEKK
jgi:hypothetical protein